MSEALTIILAVTTIFGLYGYFIYYLVKILPKCRSDESLSSQWKLADYKLLKIITEMPNGLISASDLMENYDLTKKEAKLSLSILAQNKIVKIQVGRKSKRYYELVKPIAKGPFPSLSEKPFLTLGDLMVLFKHFGYRLTLQDLCLATKLPIAFLVKELKYFIQENIVEHLRNIKNTTDTYILKEPYRSNPEDYSKNEGRIDLDLRNLYEKSEMKNHSN